MNDTQVSEKKKQELIRSTYRMAGVGIGLSGCVTVFIIGVAILVGLFLDRRLESARHLFTFILILISVPLNIMALLWVVRFTTNRFKKVEKDTQKELLQEDDNSVGS